jgi:hypothetical protein
MSPSIRKWPNTAAEERTLTNRLRTQDGYRAHCEFPRGVRLLPIDLHVREAPQSWRA